MSHEINKSIPANQIIPHPDQQRKTKGFDLESITELGESIKQHGLQQRVRVVQVTDPEWVAYLERRLQERLAETQEQTALGAFGGDKFYAQALANLQAIKEAPKQRQKALYVIVYGERRWRGHLQAELTEVNAVIDTALTREAIQDIMLLENIQREAVGFAEEAESYRFWMQSKGLNTTNPEHRKQLATALNKSVTYIKWRLDAMKLIPLAQAAMKREELTANHVYYLSRLEEAQQAKLFKMIETGRCVSLFQLEAAYKALLLEAEKLKTEQQTLDIAVVDKTKALALQAKLQRLAETLCTVADDDEDNVTEALGQMDLGEIQRLMQTLELAKRNLNHIYKNQLAFQEQALIAAKL
ncbi:MAG: ParB/RepB/Spo0J family partition protein [Stenomitos frigidus ULC029]